ncbi:coenzyme A biosynthesis bifunctional protein CoaBC [Candidatus Photodesmus blepharus]|uniref:Coenzyme A biosynthesis bifunctional protein CoaBC n=1 Tax=Candidatus Photodesmus blepharonis TaxID=1179155 RepID=A0A084CNA2_9GAMM|nr:bifunctional phosphopantothenoylcysteine decarboxylase/phosphopantothenate--cysteine ligase CoaBC [Candidatus Photodesmus blepharus]KEY91281.1 coenzyme A biosynthesis bifunctional protein CoaBC [Candidatus Photodesmus blepharus]
MKTLSEKKILLGISGGIAAYKCAELARRLIERGADIQIVMTKAAKEFITPLTMQITSGHPTLENLLETREEVLIGHIKLAKWADLILLAPATANLIARITAGIADDLLSTLILATEAPIALSPAMNQKMYLNIATQKNIATLRKRGIHVWGPISGKQACGDNGLGRMLEPTQLVELCEIFFQNKFLKGKSVLISAGPTHEALDPIRYIANRSSGKMGYALAQAARLFGAQVTLISGPVSLHTPHGITRLDVVSALEMYQAVLKHAVNHDVFISCAAVTDYRPNIISNQKIKKNNNKITVNMVKNPDIVASVATLTKNRPFTVGFSAETQNLEKYACRKLIHKNLDMICANNVSLLGQGFNSDKNKVTIYNRQGKQDLPLAPKDEVARNILLHISEHL